MAPTREQKRVLFVTNVASPYRRPVWSAMSRAVRLRVALLNPEVLPSAETPSERSADWRVEPLPSDGYETVSVPTTCVRVGDERAYVLRRSARELVRGFDAIIVTGWESPVYWQVLCAARLQKIPVVGFYESTLDSSRVSRGAVARARAFFLQRLTGVVVPGHAAARSVRAKGVKTIWQGFNAVDVDRFHAAQKAASPDPHAILYVGVLTPRKNVDSIIRALADGPEQLRLGIAGSGPQEEELRNLAEELGVADRITWHGYVPYNELPQLMASHSCLVLASHVEVWGLVANEALACGLHVVVARTCGVCESIQDMPGVFTCGTDPASIARALEQFARDYSGAIESPQILQYSPAAFAEVFLEAIGDVTGTDCRGQAVRDD